MKKITLVLAFVAVNITAAMAQINLNWDTNPTDDGAGIITETVDGITVTTTSESMTTTYFDFFGIVGSGNIVATGTADSVVTFVFSEAVKVTSILAINGGSDGEDYVFTPTGGNNLPVTQNMTEFSETVTLLWNDVTSFTVTANDTTLMGFDDLMIFEIAPLSTSDMNAESIQIYPNPVSDVLTISNAVNLESVIIYNNVGQVVLNTNSTTIDFSQLPTGMYSVRIQSANGIETKKILKN